MNIAFEISQNNVIKADLNSAKCHRSAEVQIENRISMIKFAQSLEQDKGIPPNVAELSVAIGVNAPTCRSIISILVNKGYLIKIKMGMYRRISATKAGLKALSNGEIT